MTGLVLRSSLQLDPASYRQDFPSWEPCLDDLYTSDGRRIDTHRTVRRSDNGKVLGVVGSSYVVRSNAQLAADLDALAAPFGGRLSLGAAKIIEKNARVTALVRLPEDFDSLLSVRGDRRGASLMLRDARDGSMKEEASTAIIRFACSNGMVATSAKKLVASGRHTSSIAWLTPQLEKWSRGVVEGLRETGRVLHALDGFRLTHGEARALVGEIVNPESKSEGQPKAREDKVIDLIMGADGRYVPAGSYDYVSGVQLLEAVTAYDRHFAGTGRSKDPQDIAFRRIEKLADGDGYGAKAWDLLSAMVGGAA